MWTQNHCRLEEDKRGGGGCEPLVYERKLFALTVPTITTIPFKNILGKILNSSK